MAHTSIWVPGTIVEAEHPDQLAPLIRKGWGTFFEQEGGFSWFHIPIAAPFALDGQKPRVNDRLCVLQSDQRANS